jgi:FAD:protein FMN transferase
MARETEAAAPPPTMIERRFRSMACDVVVLAPADRPDAELLVRDVFERWDARFSRFRPDSELERLNEAGGGPVAASDLMVTVVQAAVRAAQASDGLFDPLLGSRMVELGYDRTFDDLPAVGAAAAPSAWRAGVWREIVIDIERRTVQLPAGHRLDLGGLAKGMAVDAALDALVADGVPYAAVSAGGDLAVAGLPPGQGSWPVAIDGAGETVVAVRQGALATSSVLRRRWVVDGGERHHLLDPRTGLPSTGPIVQASVAAPTCAAAEVAAKMAILSDVPTAIGRLEQHRLAALLLTADGEAWRVGTWL